MQDEEQLFPMVCRCAVEYGGLSMAWVGMVDENTNLFFPAAKYGVGTDYLDRIAISSVADVPEGQGPTGVAYRENHAVIVNNFAGRPMMGPWEQAIKITGWKSSAAFPISRGGKPYAILSVYHTEPDIFDDNTVNLLEQMSGDVAFALDNFDRKNQIHYLTYHDALTGLPNRQLVREHFGLAQSYADRGNAKIGVIVLDLDNFKSINDTLGHTAGDEILKAVALRLKSCLQTTDTLSHQGGDEFLMLLTDLRDVEAITEITEKLLKSIEVPFTIDGHQLSTSSSIGIAIYPDDGHDLDSLLKKADTAMYQAKEAGKNTYRFFTEQMNMDALENMRMRASLRQAIEKSEFVLHYQPQVNLTSGKIVGAEVLIRWQHPEQGLLYPDRFLPVAEESGLLDQICDWVLLESCRQVREWSEEGLAIRTIAVNVSATQFKNRNLENSVVQAIVDSGIDPSFLELELTESALVKDANSVSATIDALKARGVSISIDDFGTGYSSLSYLKQFKVDRLKIDRSFVRDMASDESDAAIVRTIIQIARTLGLKTVAEGIEDAQVLEMLRVAGCDEAQGYYFSKPLPAENFHKFVESWPAVANPPINLSLAES